MINRLRSGGVIFIITAALLAGGCGGIDSTPAVKLDSGPVNDSYQGVAKPVNERQLKLTGEEMKNGIKKSPIKSKTGQELTPEVKVEERPYQNDKQPGGGEGAKPQV